MRSWYACNDQKMQSNSSDGSGDDISLTSLSLGPSESPTTSVNSTSPGDIIVTTTNDEQSSSTPVPTADNQIVGRENSQTFHAPVSSDPQTGSEPSTTCQGNDTAPCYKCSSNFVLEALKQVPCGHFYCNDCLRDLFVNPVTFNEGIPTQCCDQVIPIGQVRDQLAPNVIAEYEAKEAKSCTTCKKEHVNEDCPIDPQIALTEKLARRNNWKRCPKCKAFIELLDGCNHVQCICGHHFCFECRQAQGSCDCPILRHDEDIYYSSDEDVLMMARTGARNTNSSATPLTPSTDVPLGAGAAEVLPTQVEETSATSTSQESISVCPHHLWIFMMGTFEYECSYCHHATKDCFLCSSHCGVIKCAHCIPDDATIAL